MNKIIENLGEYIDNTHEKLLQKILNTRKEKKISRRKIAEDLGFTTSTYRDMEQGRTAFPLDRLIAVMKYLELPLFFDFNEKPKEEHQPEAKPEQEIEHFWKKLIQQPEDIQEIRRENTEIKALLHEILRKLDANPRSSSEDA